jgi:hypothetical protein
MTNSNGKATLAPEILDLVDPVDIHAPPTKLKLSKKGETDVRNRFGGSLSRDKAVETPHIVWHELRGLL